MAGAAIDVLQAVACKAGKDAVTAITRLALLPAALHASRVLLVWEEADFCASLYGPATIPTVSPW